MTSPAGNHRDLKNALELALLAAGQPLDLRALKRVAGGDADAAALKQILGELREDWQDRALQLIESAGGYQFISRQEYSGYLRRLNPERPPRISRSLLEALAIIAYRQPVTRGDIEQIRGIAVSSNQIAFLEEQGWIEEVGRRDTPGRPALYATTDIFLDDLGLAALSDLPPLPDMEEDSTEDLNGSGSGGGDNAGDGDDGDDDNAGDGDDDNDDGGSDDSSGSPEQNGQQ